MSGRVLFAEILDRRVGLWCPYCRSLTGAALTMVHHHADGTLTVCTIARCVECRGPVREATP